MTCAMSEVVNCRKPANVLLLENPFSCVYLLNRDLMMISQLFPFAFQMTLSVVVNPKLTLKETSQCVG